MGKQVFTFTLSFSWSPIIQTVECSFFSLVISLFADWKRTSLVFLHTVALCDLLVMIIWPLYSHPAYCNSYQFSSLKCRDSCSAGQNVFLLLIQNQINASVWCLSHAGKRSFCTLMWATAMLCPSKWPHTWRALTGFKGV